MTNFSTLPTPGSTPAPPFTSAAGPDVHASGLATPALRRRADDGRRRQTALVIAIFIAALLGLIWMWTNLTTSSASFSDQETFDGNRLGTGTLDIEVGEQTIPFSARNMAAGDTVTGQFELHNSGSLPLLYDVSAFAPESPLRNELDIVAWRSDGPCTTTPAPGEPRWLVLDTESVSSVRTGSLPAGTSQLICMSATLPLDVSQAAQGQRLDLIIGIDALHDVAATVGGES